MLPHGKLAHTACVRYFTVGLVICASHDFVAIRTAKTADLCNALWVLNDSHLIVKR